MPYNIAMVDNLVASKEDWQQLIERSKSVNNRDVIMAHDKTELILKIFINVLEDLTNEQL